MNSDELSQVQEIADRLGWAERAVAFTGAGISTESGIPDFRSPGGVWSRHKPVYYDEFMASQEARERYWSYKREAWEAMSVARPNVAHEFLARLEADGRLRGVVTQNIDGLHQRAGSKRVLELHGTNLEAECQMCHWRCPIDDAHAQMEGGKTVPGCTQCDGFLKPAVVSFGQAMPEEVLSESARWAVESDLMFAIGSSLVVFPAAQVPQLARESGAHLVIVNRDPTHLDDVASAVFRCSIGEFFSELRSRYRGAGAG